jgi:hypothetical protein
MTETEQKVEEHKVEGKKGRGDFIGKIKGSNRKETYENVSYLIIFVSAIMVSIGIGMGSFVTDAIFIAVVGAFFVVVGTVSYIASQFLK